MKKQLHEYAQEVRIQDWYKSLVRYNGEIMSREKWLQQIKPTHKTTETQIYSNKKVCLTYKKLKQPKLTYLIANEQSLYEVPKIIWDNLSLEVRD